MNLHFLGGAMEIGGSCIYIRIAGKGILMDSGIRQSNTKDPLPDFRQVQEQGGLDAIIVSHAHMDHIGTLPIISKAYPYARIYMTAMTADLTRVLLYDSLKIMNCREDEIPHYSEQDVLAMLGRIFPIGFQTPFQIFDNFTLTFYPAGHIAGASCIYLTTEEGSIFYSGDFSAFAQRTVEGIRIPKLRPDIAIMETTYGNRLHANRQVEEKRLVELVRECILQKQKILIPAFALGRAQEVLLILRSAIQNQEIPAVPVYVDGMVRDINIMYTRNPMFLKNSLGKRILKGNEPFYTKEIQPVAASQKRDELLAGKEPAIFLSSSGMLTGGPSTQYAKQLAACEDACIIITGYQDEESPGRQLLNLLENPQDRRLTIGGSTVPVRCRIEQVGLSAHGDKSEILSCIDRLCARRIFLVHGSQDAMEELGSEISAADFRRQVYLPECGQSYEITLRSKRKQLSFRPPYTLKMERAFTAEDEKNFWEYWQQHYPGKYFSIEQIAYIWYGKPIETLCGSQDTPSRSVKTDLQDAAKTASTSVLQTMQEIFLNSCYFTPNAKRLFLFEANTPDDVAKALAPKELTQQELAAQINACFAGCAYRKISYHNDRREVLLQFDFPDSLDAADFQAKASDFTNMTGWTAQISPSMNHNAASILLSALFGDKLAKTSYFTAKKCYHITLSVQEHDKEAEAEAAKQFQAVTGWRLEIQGLANTNVPHNTADTGVGSRAFFTPAQIPAEATEQNLAFFCIDQAFSELPHKPDKKSLKQDAAGKYIEVSFTSPALGYRYSEQLQALAIQIGWRIHIADKVNQNELFKTAQLLCMKYQIPLAKNPSYLPESQTVLLKISGSAQIQNQQDLIKEFDTLTGCVLSITT